MESINKLFLEYLLRRFSIDEERIGNGLFTLNIDPRKATFGDINTTIALSLGKLLQQPPLAIAQIIVNEFQHPQLASLTIAGPGFINATFTSNAIKDLAREIFTKNELFFAPQHSAPRRYSLEFVSANPTGPLHFGHGRGGIIGDTLASILTFLGHEVTKEYYINDAGNQIQKLGASLFIRCQQLLGIDAHLPEDGYHGQLPQ